MNNFFYPLSVAFSFFIYGGLIGQTTEISEKWKSEPFGNYDPNTEIVTLRDANTKHFKNENGTVTAHVASGAIHYSENGQWKTIFHTIVPTANGFENNTNVFKTTYPATSANSINTVLPNGSVLQDMNNMRMYYESNGQILQPMNIADKPGKVKFNELTYKDVYGDGIDLRLTQNTEQRKMDYIIQNSLALNNIPSGAEFLTFEETVELPSGWKAVLKENMIFIVDMNDKVQAVYEKPLLTEATKEHDHDHSDQEEHAEKMNTEGLMKSGIFEITQTGTSLIIKTKVEISWLTNPERLFPLVIDPTVNCVPNNTERWTGFIDLYSNSVDYTTSAIYGHGDDYMLLGRYTTSTYYFYCSWAKFNIAAIPDGSIINSASMFYTVYDTYSSGSDCQTNVYIRHMSSDPSTNDFSNATNNTNRLNDIRDGDIYQTRNFGGATNGANGLRSANLANNLNHLQTQLPADWFAVGLHTYSGGPHVNCYVFIRGRSHASKPYLSITYCVTPAAPLQTAANITVGPVRTGGGLGTALLADANLTTVGGENVGHEAWRGRLFNPLTTADYNWYDTYAHSNAWQADLGVVKNVNGVIVQGRINSNVPVAPTGQYVTSINVQVSSDGATWINMGNFTANTDHKTAVENLFGTPVQARYVRITPLASVSATCMRADVISIPCGAGPHQVSVSAQLPAGLDPLTNSIRWYDAASGGTLLGTGFYLTRSISQSTTFYAATFNGSCESTTRIPVTAIVGLSPTAPTISTTPTTPVCGDPVTLSVGSAQLITESAHGLVAHLPFNGNLNDVSGNGLNLTGSGGSFVTDGLQLTTASSYTSAVSSVLNNDYHTISFYMKYTAAPDGSWRKIFGYEPAGSDRSPGIWRYPGENRLHWRYDAGNTGGGETQFYALNTWYHVVGVKNGSNFSIYVNGTLVESVTVASPKFAGNAALFFGGAQVVLRDFKIFNRSLTSTQITKIGQWKWYTGSCGGTYVGTGPSITVNPATQTTYYVRAENSCGNSSCASFTYNVSSVAPTSATGGGNYCHGNDVTLSSVGGTNGSGSVDVWYKGSCNEAFTERWNTAPSAYGNTIVNSVSNGILNVTSTSLDPMIDMYTLGSFSPTTYRYINVRYRVTSATAAGNMQFFWTNGLYGGAHGSQVRTQAISSTQNVWQIVSIDMANTALGPGDWYHSNVTGWRFDWATTAGVTMEIDFITLSQGPMVAQGTSYSIAPTATETYYTKKIGSCGSTSCQSATVTMPNVGTSLAGDGTRTATCTVSGSNWVHFYDNGELLVSINANGGNLGSVTAISYVDANDNAILTQACNTGSNPQWTTAALGRRWKITPTNNTSALIRFPFEDGEFSKLVIASNNTTANGLDNVSTYGDLKMSHYSGGPSLLNLNGNWADNCPSLGGAGGTQLVPMQTPVPSGNVVNITNGFKSNVANGRFVQFTTPGFSEFWLHNSENPSALPVALTNLSAKCNDQKDVEINWITASEQNSDKFILEKSRDMVDWTFVAETNAAGNSNTVKTYSEVDLDAHAGISYYRLIQLDFDGQKKIFDPIGVSCESSGLNTIHVSPNPNNGSFTVELTSMKSIDFSEIQVIDMTGKIVMNRAVAINEGVSKILFNNEILQQGMYIVHVKTEDNLFNPVRVMVRN